MRISTLLIAAGVASHHASATVYAPCPDGLKCITVTPPNEPEFTFNCSVAAPPANATELGFVYHMHGDDSRYAKAMWADDMKQLAALGYTSLACDQRGYSIGASPYNIDAYNYDYLVQDIFSIVNATYGTGKFHIVSHDQGARISWHAIAQGEIRERLLSFTSLSIPQSDVFSAAIYGPNAYEPQQTAAEYVRVLTLPNSTLVYNETVFTKVCGGLNWPTPELCQPSFWWYNGAINSGAMALAPFNGLGPIGEDIGIPMSVVGNLTQYPTEGVGQSVFVGNVTEFPVFYACGAKDTADLCIDLFENESAALISDFSYLRVDDCGHDIISSVSACSQQQEVIDGIIANIQKGTPSQ